jgi:hypothetical protein
MSALRAASRSQAKRIADLSSAGVNIRGVTGASAMEAKRNAEVNDQTIAAESEFIARAALIREEQVERDLSERVDLIKMRAQNPDLFPLECGMWHILLQKWTPSAKMGIIEKTATQMQAEEYLTVIGKVIMVGPTAFEGKTESGIELSKLCASVKTPEDLIGKYVIHSPYTGSDIYFAPLPSIKLKMITATEILAVTTMPSMFARP